MAGRFYAGRRAAGILQTIVPRTTVACCQIAQCAMACRAVFLVPRQRENAYNARQCDIYRGCDNNVITVTMTFMIMHLPTRSAGNAGITQITHRHFRHAPRICNFILLSIVWVRSLIEPYLGLSDNHVPFENTAPICLICSAFLYFDLHVQGGQKMAQFFWYTLTSSNINRF